MSRACGHGAYFHAAISVSTLSSQPCVLVVCLTQARCSDASPVCCSNGADHAGAPQPGDVCWHDAPRCSLSSHLSAAHQRQPQAQGSQVKQLLH